VRGTIYRVRALPSALRLTYRSDATRAARRTPSGPPPLRTGPSAPVMAPRSPDARPEARLEAILSKLTASPGLHAVTMTVTSGDGRLHWSGARGEARPGGPPMTADTPWFTASITKLFIAATVMRLVEEGALALRDRVVDRLPSRLTQGLHVLDGVDRTQEITVEHLLAHASGLADFIEDLPAQKAPRRAPIGGGAPADSRPAGPDRRSLVEILTTEGDRDWTLDDTVERVRAALRPHFPPQRLDAPKVRIRYSDTNYQLLIGIVEETKGASFADVLAETVLDPLHLESTWLPGHRRGATLEPGTAALYAGSDVVTLTRFLSSIADLNSTSTDLIRFLRALTRGGLFRDPDTWPRMGARWHGFGFPRDRAALRQPGWPIDYGLGVMRFQLPRFVPPFRTLPAVIGHSGSTGTWLFHAPEPDLYLVGSVSQIEAGAVPYRIVPKILQAVGSYSGGA